MAEDMRQMTDRQDKLQKLIKEEYGWETQIGWNIHNGVLTQVTVVVDGNEVGNETVSTLETRIKNSIEMVFEKKPKHLFIQISSQQERT